MADSKKGKRNKGKAPKADGEAKKADARADEAAKAADEKDEAAEKDAPIDEDEATAEEAAAHGDDEDDDHGHDDHAGHDHAPGAHAAGAHGAGAAHAPHAHAPNIKEYMVIFAALALLTALEVGVTKVPGVAKGLMTLALVGLALTKAAIVALYYMHLKHETRVLKLTVALPMAAPTIYALVLISEAAWRLTR